MTEFQEFIEQQRFNEEVEAEVGALIALGHILQWIEKTPQAVTEKGQKVVAIYRTAGRAIYEGVLGGDGFFDDLQYFEKGTGERVKVALYPKVI